MSTFIFLSHYHNVILSVTHCCDVIQNLPHDVTLRCTGVGFLTAVVCLFHCCTVSQGGRLCLSPGVPPCGIEYFGLITDLSPALIVVYFAFPYFPVPVSAQLGDVPCDRQEVLNVATAEPR